MKRASLAVLLLIAFNQTRPEFSSERKYSSYLEAIPESDIIKLIEEDFTEFRPQLRDSSRQILA